MEPVETDVTVSETGTKSRTAYNGTLRKQKDQSSSSESDFSDQDRSPEDKVNDEGDSDAMSDSERRAGQDRRKAKKQEKKERKRLAKQEQREQEASIKRQIQLAEAIRKWRETATPPDYNVYPELDPHSEDTEVFEVPDDDEDEEQRQTQEDMTEYQTDLDKPIGDEFSDRTSSEGTGNEKT